MALVTFLHDVQKCVPPKWSVSFRPGGGIVTLCNYILILASTTEKRGSPLRSDGGREKQTFVAASYLCLHGQRALPSPQEVLLQGELPTPRICGSGEG